MPAFTPPGQRDLSIEFQRRGGCPAPLELPFQGACQIGDRKSVKSGQKATIDRKHGRGTAG
jgi:hypothetical protein